MKTPLILAAALPTLLGFDAPLASFRSHLGFAAAAPMQNGQAVLVSKRAPDKVELTADPGSPAWRGAVPVVIETDYNGKPVPGHRTEVRSVWTPEVLHILFVNHYQELNLKANPDLKTETQRLWDWDVSEVFLGSDFKRITSYKEFQVSPQGEFLDLDIDRTNPNGQPGAAWNSGMRVRARIDATKKIWYGEFQIPFRDLGLANPRPGTELRAGIFRMAGRAPARQYLSWQPTDGKTFHMPEKFGILRLSQR